MLDRSFILFIAFLIFTSLQHISAQPNIGSRNCEPDTTLYDSRFTAMREWAKAGVEGGIPNTETTKILARLTPGDDLQDAINSAAISGGGVVLLTKGEYSITSTITLVSGVILRGTEKDSVLISIKIHGYHFSTGKPRQSALFISNKHHVGIENLTIKYTGTFFEPKDKDALQTPWDKDVFHTPELRDTTLFVESIWFENSKNCWVRNCNILWAGSDPIRITNSEHITCTGNFIDRSYNKCDGGMGYYNIINSKYVLVYYEHIKRIRHFAIQNGSMYNVVMNNYLEVDINFHDGDGGYNLIEQNTIHIPQWHSWHCFQRGDPRQHQVPGKFNILFRNVAHYKNGSFEFSNPDAVYEINSTWGGKNALETNISIPESNTFYKLE